MTRPFTWYHIFLPCDLDLEVWSTFKKNTWTFTWFMADNFRSRRDRTLILHECIACDKAGIMRCLSIVMIFSYFRLLLWNHRTEFNETWQEARFQRPLPSLCFSSRSEKRDDCPGLSLAETFSTSHLKSLNGIQWNLTGSKFSTSSTKFLFLGPMRK